MIIFNVYETEKIKWLYQNQLVKSSELNESSLKLQLLWSKDQREQFNKSFADKAS